MAYRVRMEQDRDETQPKRWRVWLGGSIALGVWFAMLYFMFGDVL